jgi:thiamine biosynthesis lipoprotein
MAVLTPPAGIRALYTNAFRVRGGPAVARFIASRGRSQAARIAGLAEAGARRIEAKVSRYREDSVVSQINAAAGGAPVPVDAETEALIRSALDLAALTAGRFDPTVGVMRRVWDFRAGRVPSPAEVEALLPLADARRVELDLGGVGKEPAVDRVAGLLQREGVESALITFAGDVRTVGRRGDGEPWTIAAQDPRDPGRCPFALLAASGAGVATSGDDERAFLRDGARYHPLLDARTGSPARGLASATVLACTASEAGRLSTVAFLLGPEDGLRLMESAPGAEGALIAEDGGVLPPHRWRG